MADFYYLYPVKCMTMKYWLTILTALIVNSWLFSQSTNDTVDTDQLIIEAPAFQKAQAENRDIKRLDADLTVGTSFMYSPGNFYGPSFYMAPSLSYRINPRFTLTSGVALEQGNFYSLSGAGEDKNMLPMTRAFLFARGSYQLTSRLTLGGGVYKAINTMPQLSQYQPAYNYNYQGVSFDLNYKITPSFSVGFQMRIQDGNFQYQEDGLIPPAGYVPVQGF